MSLVRSILPPPVQVPASIANGCTLAGAAGGTSSASGDWTCPSGMRSIWIWAAAGTKADASTKAAAPQISFNVMALSPLTEISCLHWWVWKAFRFNSHRPNSGLVDPCSLNPWAEQHQRRQFALEQPAQRDAAVSGADPEILLVEV